jgi:hypothetical protein
VWLIDAHADTAKTALASLEKTHVRRSSMALLNSDPRPTTAVQVALAAAAPLAGVALAYGLWWICDRLLYIGPMDRAKFGWLVVVPVWSLTPVLAAPFWRQLNPRQTVAVAAIVGLVLAASAALLFWLAAAAPDCEFGAVRSPAEWVLPSLIIGLVVGGGFAAACLGTTAVARRLRWWAVLLVGAGSAFALVFVAIMVATPFILSGGCQRPLPI